MELFLKEIENVIAANETNNIKEEKNQNDDIETSEIEKEIKKEIKKEKEIKDIEEKQKKQEKGKNESGEYLIEENGEYLIQESEEYLIQESERIIEEKNKDGVHIQSKINMFVNEIDFINKILDIYEKKRQREKNLEDSHLIKNNLKNESDEILKDVISLELGFKNYTIGNEIEQVLLQITDNLEFIKNKDFVLTAKKSLDIRVNDYRNNEISDKYFSKTIIELAKEVQNQIEAEIVEQKEKEKEEEKQREKEKEKEKQKEIEEKKQKQKEEGLQLGQEPGLESEPALELGLRLGMELGSASTSALYTSKNNFRNINLVKDAKQIVSSEGIKEANKEGKKKSHTLRKTDREQRIETTSFFHKKKLKLVDKWKRVAEQSKLSEDTSEDY